MSRLARVQSVLLLAVAEECAHFHSGARVRLASSSGFPRQRVGEIREIGHGVRVSMDAHAQGVSIASAPVTEGGRRPLSWRGAFRSRSTLGMRLAANDVNAFGLTPHGRRAPARRQDLFGRCDRRVCDRVQGCPFCGSLNSVLFLTCN